MRAALGGLSGNVLTATSVRVLLAGFALGTIAAAGALLKIKGVAAAASVNGVLTLSGTQIDVSKATLIGGTSISAGSVLEVKGTWDGTTLQATTVEFEGAREARIGGRNELYGVVSSITGTVAVVNGLSVDLSTAVFSHGSSAQVVVGSYLEIQGDVVGNTLMAKKAELKNGATANGVAFEQSGTVSNFVSLSNFKLGGLTVNAATATLESKAGSTLIANGSYLEVTGKLDANNVFVATKVEFK